DVSCYLPHSLTVSPGNSNNRRPFAGYPDVVGNREWDVVTVAELQVEDAALNLSPIADAGDLEIDRKASRHSGDHIVDQRTGRSPHRTRVLGFALWRDRNRAIDDRGGDLIAERQAQRAQLPF